MDPFIWNCLENLVLTDSERDVIECHASYSEGHQNNVLFAKDDQNLP